MRRQWLLSVVLMLAVVLTLTGATRGFQETQDRSGQFSVTVTNLTKGQTFTPILVASHRAGVKLFTLGKPASVPLQVLAEAGDTGPLEALLSSSPRVLDVTDSGAPLPPGGSATLVVRTQGSFNHLSVAAMLVPTNDGFLAINDDRGPDDEGVITLYSPAYDAGTKGDDELCAHIPGPPTVCQGEGFNPDRARNDVNFVHIHAGIHGVGDLNPAAFDWRNPVAKIAIRRTQ